MASIIQQTPTPPRSRGNSPPKNQPAWDRTTKLVGDTDPFDKRVHSDRFPLPPDYSGSRYAKNVRSQSADSHRQAVGTPGEKGSPFVIPAENRKHSHPNHQPVISPVTKQKAQHQLHPRNTSPASKNNNNNNNRSASATSQFSNYSIAMAAAGPSSSSRSASSPTREHWITGLLTKGHRSVSATLDLATIASFDDQQKDPQQLMLSLAWEKEKQNMLKLSSEQLIRKSMQMHFDVLRLRRKRASDNANVYRLRKCREFVAACGECIEEVNLRMAIMTEKVAETKILSDHDHAHSSPLSKVLQNDNTTNNNNNNQDNNTDNRNTNSSSFFRSTDPEEDTGPLTAEPNLSKNLSYLLDALETSEAVNNKLLEIALHERDRANENHNHILELDEVVTSLQAGRVELLNLHANQIENYELQLSDLRIQLQDKDDEHMRATEDMRDLTQSQAHRIADLEQAGESLQINLTNEEQKSNRALHDIEALAAEIRMLQESLEQESRELKHNRGLLDQERQDRQKEKSASLFADGHSIADTETIARLRIELESRTQFDRVGFDFRQELKFLNDRRRLSDIHGRSSVGIETDMGEGSQLKKIVEKSKQIIDAVHERIFAVSKELEETKRNHEVEIGEMRFANQFKLLRAAEIVKRANVIAAEEADSAVVLKRVLFHDFDDAIAEMEWEAGEEEEFFFSDDGMVRTKKQKQHADGSEQDFISNEEQQEENSSGKEFVFEDEIGEYSFFVSRRKPQPKKASNGNSRSSSKIHNAIGEEEKSEGGIEVSGGDDGAEDFFGPPPAPVPKWHQILSEAWSKQPRPSEVEQTRQERHLQLQDSNIIKNNNNNNNNFSSSTASATASLNETQKESPDLISQGPISQQQQQNQNQKTRSALDDLANGDVSDEMLEIGEQQQGILAKSNSNTNNNAGSNTPPSEPMTSRPHYQNNNNENDHHQPQEENNENVHPFICTQEEYDALKAKVDKQQQIQKMLQGKLVRSLTSGILGEKEEDARQEILLNQYVEIATVLRKYMLAAHQLVGVAKAQQRRASFANQELEKERRSMNNSRQNSRSESTINTSRENNHNNKEISAPDENNNTRKPTREELESNVNNNDDDDDGSKKKNVHPPSALSPPKSVENFAQPRQQQAAVSSPPTNNNDSNVPSATAENILLQDDSKEEGGEDAQKDKNLKSPKDNKKGDNDEFDKHEKTQEQEQEQLVENAEEDSSSAPIIASSTEPAQQENQEAKQSEDSAEQQEQGRNGDDDGLQETSNNNNISRNLFAAPPPTTSGRDRSMPVKKGTNQQQGAAVANASSPSSNNNNSNNTNVSAPTIPPISTPLNSSRSINNNNNNPFGNSAATSNQNNNNNNQPRTSTLSGGTSPRASPTRFNDEIMRMLEEARRAFQNADDEAQKLLHYLEPSPPPPPSGKKK